MIEMDQGQKELYCNRGWTMICLCPECERRPEIKKFKRHGHTALSALPMIPTDYRRSHFALITTHGPA